MTSHTDSVPGSEPNPESSSRDRLLEGYLFGFVALVVLLGLLLYIASRPRGVPESPYGDWVELDGSHWLVVRDKKWLIKPSDPPTAVTAEGMVRELENGWQFSDAEGHQFRVSLSEDYRTITFDGVTYQRVLR